MSRAGQLVALARLRRATAERRRVDADERLRRLVEHARTRSPHYRRVLAGLEGAPLAELPVLTKDDLVARFDDLVTDPALRRADLEAVVAGGRAAGRYRVAASSGSSGRPALTAFDAREWAGLLAAAASMRALAGGGAGPRSAKVGSPSPWHLSAQLGATLQDPRRPALRLPVTTPLPALVEALDGFRPDILTAYPSVLAQLAGRLRISPAQVFAGGEVLGAAVRDVVAEAWGSEPFDQYVTTEAGPVAGECTAHDGLHVLGDHVVVEVVDDAHQPVPDGTFGSAVLVTVLSSRTVPLIRYALDDRATLATAPCACGRPGPRIAAIAGRSRDLLRLPGADVHPAVLTAVLDTMPVAGWQVVQEGERLRVLVAGQRAGFDAPAVQQALLASLADLGVTSVAVDVESVDALRTAAGSGKADRFVVSDGGR